ARTFPTVARATTTAKISSSATSASRRPSAPHNTPRFSKRWSRRSPKWLPSSPTPPMSCAGAPSRARCTKSWTPAFAGETLGFGYRCVGRRIGALASLLDRALDGARVGRLDEVVIEPGGDGALAILALPVARHGDEQRVAGIAALAQLARYGIA